MKTGINYRIDGEPNTPSVFARNFADFKAGGVDYLSIVLYWGTFNSSGSNYVASEYAKLKNVISAALAAGLEVHLDFHTLFPQSTSGWATPTDLGGDARKMLVEPGKTQFLNWVSYTMQQVAAYLIKEVAVLNEPSRYTLTTAQKTQTVQLWIAARDVVKAVMPNALVGVRFDLSGLKQFSVSDELDTLDIAFVNEYLDHRNPNYSIWGSTWNDLVNYLNAAKSRGMIVEVTEWNGYATTPVITQDYMSGHLAKLQSLGFDAAYFWGWKGASSWEWDLAQSDGITPKVPLSVFNLSEEPTTGILEVHSFLDGVETPGTVTIDSSSLPNPVEYATPITIEINTGSYQLTCAVPGQAPKSTSASVQNALTTRVDFQFSTSMPPVTPGFFLPMAFVGGIVLLAGTGKKRRG